MRQNSHSQKICRLDTQFYCPKNYRKSIRTKKPYAFVERSLSNGEHEISNLDGEKELLPKVIFPFLPLNFNELKVCDNRNEKKGTKFSSICNVTTEVIQLNSIKHRNL